jgi:hypothetical protein
MNRGALYQTRNTGLRRFAADCRVGPHKGHNHDVTVRAIRTKRGLSFIDIEQQE